MRVRRRHAFLRSAGIVRNVERGIKLPTLRAKNADRPTFRRIEIFTYRLFINGNWRVEKKRPQPFV